MVSEGFYSIIVGRHGSSSCRCRFCGFSAPQLNQNITQYAQNQRMFRTFLEEIKAVAGNEYGIDGGDAVIEGAARNGQEGK